MEATTSKEGGLNERGPKAIAHEMGLQVSHGVHSEVGGIQCGGIHQGEECNLDCPELSGTETPFDREEFLSARLFRFHGGDGQTIRAGIHLAAGAGGAAGQCPVQSGYQQHDVLLIEENLRYINREMKCTAKKRKHKPYKIMIARRLNRRPRPIRVSEVCRPLSGRLPAERVFLLGSVPGDGIRPIDLS